jgi:hypothetical protein
MKYVTEMVLGGMIYTPSFIKIGSDTHKLLSGEGEGHAHTEKGDLISLLFFSKNKKCRLKMKKKCK